MNSIEAAIERIDELNTTGDWYDHGVTAGLLLALKILNPNYRFKEEWQENVVREIIKGNGLSI